MPGFLVLQDCCVHWNTAGNEAPNALNTAQMKAVQHLIQQLREREPVPQDWWLTPRDIFWELNLLFLAKLQEPICLHIRQFRTALEEHGGCPLRSQKNFLFPSRYNLTCVPRPAWRPAQHGRQIPWAQYPSGRDREAAATPQTWYHLHSSSFAVREAVACPKGRPCREWLLPS